MGMCETSKGLAIVVISDLSDVALGSMPKSGGYADILTVSFFRLISKGLITCPKTEILIKIVVKVKSNSFFMLLLKTQKFVQK